MSNDQHNNPQQNDTLDSANDVNTDSLDNANDANNSLNADGVMMRMDYARPSQVIDSQVIEQQVIDSQVIDSPVNTDASLSQDNSEKLTQHVALFTELNRQDVKFHAKVKSPLLFRDTLSALFDVVSSDYRYVPKDRSAYSVFMQMRRANANKNLFTAQRQYFEWLFNNDPLAFCILDPIIQVHEQGISFEVFSRDEGCYAQLTLSHDIFASQSSANGADNINYGTTSIDYSSALYEGIQRIRDYTPTSLDIGHEAVSLQRLNEATNNDNQQANGKSEANNETNEVEVNEVIEKRINVPKNWIRSLLQVQSASQLPQDSIELDPIALYNVLFELRMHADIKGKRRGLLIELRPQQQPIIILEPFNIAVTSQVSKHARPYQGSQAKLIRLWGRRRLALLKRLLPHCKTVNVSLLGQGMPSYWTLAGDGFHFTFAMTGFSQSNWSQALGFDLLLPKRPQSLSIEGEVDDNANNNSADQSDLQALLEQLQQQPSSLADLAKTNKNNKDNKESKANKTAIRQQLLSASQQGFIRYDMATQTYYYRPLTQTPLDMQAFAYHNPAEKQAYDLVSRADAIRKFSVDNLASQGILIQADIHVSEDRRSYHSQLQLGDEGIVSRAECSCPQFLQHRLTQGVCSHLIALRLAYNDFDASRDPQAQANWQETRILSKRINMNTNGTNANNNATNTQTDEQSNADFNPVLDLTALSNSNSKDNRKNNSKDDNSQDSNNHNSHAGMSSVNIQQVQITLKAKKVIIEYLNHDPRKRKYQHYQHQNGQGETTGDSNAINTATNTRQQFVFNQPKQAKQAFLQHIAKFEADGFIENQGV
ncbi:hypothetical protein [Psychrobacter sp. I-STPA10]|uniref:hypothetical protein n=1 Tax=Psychrobacter sp. I-STPA10 TaxID=2585769 RepID=UPI001E28A2C1|nr:hypothetical protein [Psychrobacter sp. I-STPA10]